MLDSVSPYIEAPEIELDPEFDKPSFLSKLQELVKSDKYISEIFDKLEDPFYIQN